jgi:hypothetical protein
MPSAANPIVACIPWLTVFIMGLKFGWLLRLCAFFLLDLFVMESPASSSFDVVVAYHA